MKAFSTVFKEAIVVGILLIVFVYISAFILQLVGYPMKKIKDVCANWNSTYIMEATTFLAGAMFHLACEYTGINEWYVKNYYN